MSGFFGAISKTGCVKDVFYGTDYHSHFGTKRAGTVFIVPGEGFRRSKQNLKIPVYIVNSLRKNSIITTGIEQVIFRKIINRYL